jgi:ATP-dependent DNA helicase RecQ
VILGYFGDKSEIHCGHCDNCEGSGPSTTRTPIDTEAGREVLLKALSGVARARGKFGKTMVAQMLVGSKSDKLARWRLDELSTFGILGSFRQAEVATLLDALTRAGLVEAQEVDSFRPIVLLSETGKAFLKEPAATPVALDLPADLAAKVNLGGLARIAAKPSAASPRSVEERPEPVDLSALQSDPLWERLRDLRREYSREEGRPAYSIFPDDTLASLVRDRPKNPGDLLRIKGMGPSRLEKYGRAILEAVAEAGDVTHEPPPVAARPEPPRETRPSSSSAYVPTEEWTWRLLDRGFTPQEAAAIRGLDLSAIFRHATLAARQGKAVSVEAFISADVLDRWRAWRAENGDRPAPDAASHADAWALFLASS